VRREVVRLKALMREDGTCRALADLFNRRFAATKRMTVGKTFVAEVLRTHRYEILAARREIRSARPRRVPRNLVWAADLAGKTTLDARTHAVLGILEHASRAALLLLGIRHQRIDPHCPWQNGRVERFFGTLKRKLDRLAVHAIGDLNRVLVEFRFFYNHVRPHRNLGGATPADAWAGAAPYAAAAKAEYWFEAWDGLLKGYYLRR
jgi:transposase InsO family protein